MIGKGRLLALMMALGLLALAACADQNETSGDSSSSEALLSTYAPAVSEMWTSPGSSVCAWFSEDEPGDFMGVNTEPSIMRVGKTSEGKNIFSFIHLPLRGTWLSDEIESARLYLKVVDGKTPSALRIGLVKNYWSTVDLAGAKELYDPESAASVTVKKEDDGWVSVDITGYVKDWLSGSVQNNGLVLLGETVGEQVSFASDWDKESENPPRLEVRGAVGKRNLGYGKFAYLRHPEKESDDVVIAENETANCLSYALRDTDVIGASELGLDYGVLTAIYRQSGEDAVADYCAEKVAEYVERNKTGLKISGFRQIQDFDSKIDAAKEYRIAFRVGCKLYSDEDVLDDAKSNFDYHVWAQINTGQWAQKFMFTPTEIVPGTPPGVSPGNHPWDGTLDWEQEKFHAFETSKVIYFAVTKDADGFTQHRS